MGTNWKAIVGAYLTLAVLYLVGVLLLLDPIAASDAPTGPLVPLPVGFGVAIAIYVTLFAWIERMIGDPYKAAMAIALSQLTLVNIDFVLSGKRGIETAAASTVLLLVSWTATAWVYSRLRPESSSRQ